MAWVSKTCAMYLIVCVLHLESGLVLPIVAPRACGGPWLVSQEKKTLPQDIVKKVISDSGFSLIDFCQKNCNSMSMGHAHGIAILLAKIN